MADNKEWTIGFKNNSFFRISENPYYIKKGKGIGLKEMDYCYLTEDSLDFIECKEVKSISKVRIDCALKGVHSLSLVKTGLLENNDQFLSGINKLSIRKDIGINVYFIFKADYEQKSQLLAILPFIEKNIKCFSSIWNINKVHVLTFKQAKNKLKYLADEKYL